MFILVLLWFFRLMWFGSCSALVFAVVAVVVLVLRSFVALVFGLVCGLRVGGVLLFAPWFYADCVVRGFG